MRANDEGLDVPDTGRPAEDDGGQATGGDDQTVTVFLYMGRGYKFSKHKEYGMQVGFTSEPDEETLELARAQMEGYMRAEGIRGEIVYEMMQAEWPASMIPEEAFDVD